MGKSNNVYLHLGVAYPNQMFSSGVLIQKTLALPAHGTQWLKDLEGNTVSVTGIIELCKGTAQL